MVSVHVPAAAWAVLSVLGVGECGGLWEFGIRECRRWSGGRLKRRDRYGMSRCVHLQPWKAPGSVGGTARFGLASRALLCRRPEECRRAVVPRRRRGMRCGSFGGGILQVMAVVRFLTLPAEWKVSTSLPRG